MLDFQLALAKERTDVLIAEAAAERRADCLKGSRHLRLTSRNASRNPAIPHQSPCIAE